MSATTTMLDVETRVRREHLKDTYSGAYRWSSQTVLVFVHSSIEDLVSFNAWAKYDQTTGELLTAYNVPTAKALSPMAEGAALDSAVSAVQALTVPVDDRWIDAIVHFAASRCLSIDDEDTSNLQKAADLKKKAVELALS